MVEILVISVWMWMKMHDDKRWQAAPWAAVSILNWIHKVMEEPGGNLSESNIFDCSILAFKFFFRFLLCLFVSSWLRGMTLLHLMAFTFEVTGQSVPRQAFKQVISTHTHCSCYKHCQGWGPLVVEEDTWLNSPKRRPMALLMPRRVQQAAVRVVKLKLRRTAARRKIRRSSRSRIRRRVKGREKSFRLAKTATTSFDFKQRSLESWYRNYIDSREKALPFSKLDIKECGSLSRRVQ